MTKDRASKYTIDRVKFRRLVGGTLTKLRLAGNVTCPESRMLWGVFDLAVRDWTGCTQGVTRFDSKAAGDWLRGPVCAHYLNMVGVDPDYAREKVGRLKTLAHLVGLE